MDGKILFEAERMCGSAIGLKLLLNEKAYNDAVKTHGAIDCKSKAYHLKRFERLPAEIQRTEPD